MGFFSRSYEPGGQHHVRITDGVFDEALKLLADDAETKIHYKEIASKYDLNKYEAHDFPVTEILGAFLLAYELQEDKNGVPENLRIGNIELGRKDQVEYNKFVDKFNQKIQSKADRKSAAWAQKGITEGLLTMAASGIGKGIAKVATGKSEDVRDFEKTYVNYICGDSEKARNYLLKFATEFGGMKDEGMVDVANAIRQNYWISEFAKNNRS